MNSSVAANDVGRSAAAASYATDLRRRFRRAERARSIGAWLLIAPSIGFMLFFFVVPIASFLVQSVDNSEIRRALPQTAETLSGWDGQGLPPDVAYDALAADFATLPDLASAAMLGRRLNYNLTGFRQLVMRTASRLPGTPEGSWRQTLASIDQRWNEPAFWQVLYLERNRLTPLHLLASLDLERTMDGLQRVEDDRRLFVSLIVRTLTISLVVTGICVVLGFPLAYATASAGPRLSNWMLVLILLPFWTSLLVRTTAWIIILQRQGLVNQGLESIGLISEPLALIYNRLGVYIAMVHVLLPFLVLPLYSVMRRIDPSQMRAGAGLGGPPLTVFRRIYLPQVMPGLIAGASLVFVLALGYYVTPALVGGPGDQMIAYFIAYFTSDSVNWGMAASLSIVLLFIVVLIFGTIARLVGLQRLQVR